MTTSLTTLMLQSFVVNLMDSNPLVEIIRVANYVFTFSFSGATVEESTDIDTSSGPLFLSSVDCSETDQSLLDECDHETLGLASCDVDFGLAVVKCFGWLLCIHLRN